MEVINEDYADFVSLSTKLVNVDGAVLRMQKPLLELRVRAPPWHALNQKSMLSTPFVTRAFLRLCDRWWWEKSRLAHG